MSGHIHRFYRLQGARAATRTNDLAVGYSTEFWTPSWRRPIPPGNRTVKFWVWFLFDRVGLFRSSGYGVLVAFRGGRVVHRTCVFPRFFRFPFMNTGDLQVGDVWTLPSARGEGLATAALREVCRRVEKDGTAVWYLVEDSNAASIRVVEKAGFELVGFGSKHPRAGLLFLGYYSLDRRHQDANPSTGSAGK